MCIIIYARYTFNLDDVWMWLDILHDKPIFNGYQPHAGRFFPLASIDLNLLMPLSHSPYAFFTLNALIVLSSGILLWKILDCVFQTYCIPKRYQWFVLAMFVGLFLHPGFVSIMVGICYPERLESLCLLAFVYASLRFYLSPRVRYMALGIVSANLAIYLKEPTFLAIGVFGLFGLVMSARGDGAHKKRALVYYGLLVLSAVAFLTLYLWLVYPQILKSYQRPSVISEALRVLKGLANFSLNDCFVIWLFGTLAAYRAYKLLWQKARDSLFFDALLFSGMAYLGAFIALRLFEHYYLIPVYILGGASVVYYLFALGYAKKLFFKVVAIICCALFALNALPTGIYTFVWLKGEGVRFHQSLEFIAAQARQNPHITLYFDGNGRGRNYNTWYWGYFGRYLQEVYHISNFDIKAHEPNHDGVALEHSETSSLSIYSQSAPSTPSKGDFIIINSSSHHFIDSTYLKNMAQKYDLVYQSSAFTLPYITPKSLIKYAFSSASLIGQIKVGDENIFRLPQFDYIYQVR